jgi:hypothetical protein
VDFLTSTCHRTRNRAKRRGPDLTWPAAVSERDTTIRIHCKFHPER